MKYPQIPDLLVNVLIPLIIGACAYVLRDYLNLFLQAHFADACWAYSFASLILIIWQRRIHKFWLATAFLASVLFEVLQYRGLVPGTADFYDIISYLFSFILTITFNPIFNYLFYEERNFK